MTIHNTLESEYIDLLVRCNCTELLWEHDKVPSQLTEQLLAEGLRSESEGGKITNTLHGRSKEELFRALKERLGGTRGLAFAVNKIFGKVQDSATEYAWNLPFFVYAGQFPTGSFNAQAIRVQNGALLLLNTGLMMFIYQCAKVLALNAHVSVQNIPGEQKEAAIAPKMSHDEVVEAIADIVLAYLFRGQSTFASRFPFQTGVRGKLILDFAQSADFFVLAHEYGHALAGHLTPPKTIRRAIAQSEVELEFVEKDWEQEIEADVYALKLLIPPSKRVVTTQAEIQQFVFRITGPFFFFALDEMTPPQQNLWVSSGSGKLPSV